MRRDTVIEKLAKKKFLDSRNEFFPGREFKSWDDLNRQAFEWATQIMAVRPQTKANCSKYFL